MDAGARQMLRRKTGTFEPQLVAGVVSRQLLIVEVAVAMAMEVAEVPLGIPVMDARRRAGVVSTTTDGVPRKL